MNENSRLATRVLVIDDEPQIRRLLRAMLEGTGYCVIEAATGNNGIMEAAQSRPEIIVLDLGLPDLDGLEVLQRLREWSRVPVIILSVRDREKEKISALDAGADDYVTKPFSSGELLARLRAALRHSRGQESESVFRKGALEVDLATRTVRNRNKEVKLTPIEYSLLRLFVTHAGKVVTQRQILTEIWGPNSKDTQSLRVHIAHLRDKIEENPSCPSLLLTEPSIGYRLMGE